MRGDDPRTGEKGGGYGEKKNENGVLNVEK
jgi:hypothetical protein